MAIVCACDTFITEVAVVPSGFGGSAGTGHANIDIGGANSSLNLWRRSLVAFPGTPAQCDRFALYNPDGNLRLWSSGTLNLVTITFAGNLGIGATNPSKPLEVVGGSAKLNAGVVFGTSTQAGAPGIHGDGTNLYFEANNRTLYFRPAGDGVNTNMVVLTPGGSLQLTATSGAITINNRTVADGNGCYYS